VVLEAYVGEEGPRPLGTYTGPFEMADDVDATPADVLAAFEGDRCACCWTPTPCSGRSRPDRLAPPAHDAILDGRNVVLTSAVCQWDISITRALGKLTFADDLGITSRPTGSRPCR
jgi:hypothetical protein